MKVTIVGAGFSGLTLAYFLAKRGDEVEIYEKCQDPGGLLRTRSEFAGPVETAANGVLNTVLVEKLFGDIGVRLAERKKTRSRRFIFRGRPRQWPLSNLESIQFLFKLVVACLTRTFWPRERETIADWGVRIGGRAFSQFLLSPALQGVYAGDPRKMSADLILRKKNSAKAKAKEKPKSKGTVAPAGGMGEVSEKLTFWLRQQGVQFHFGSELKGLSPTVVVATSAWDAADFLRPYDGATAALLDKVDSLPLVSATLFFTEPPTRYRGFGCLFPEEEQFHSLGVLFNTDIFENRGARSETWILGGAKRREMVNESDEQLLDLILSDRRRLFSNSARPHASVQRWPRALPHYTVEWRETLSRLRPVKGLYLTGNYLGAIGLSSILQFNQELAEKLHA